MKTLYLCDSNLVVSPMAQLMHNANIVDDSQKAVSASFVSDHSDPRLYWKWMVNKNIYPFLEKKEIELSDNFQNQSLFPEFLSKLDFFEKIIFLTNPNISPRSFDFLIESKTPLEYVENNFTWKCEIHDVQNSDLESVYNQLLKII